MISDVSDFKIEWANQPTPKSHVTYLKILTLNRIFTEMTLILRSQFGVVISISIVITYAMPINTHWFYELLKKKLNATFL